MRTSIFLVCLVVSVGAQAGPPIPDVYRDRYLLHGAHYIRSEAVIDDALSYVSVASGNGVAAVAYVDESEDVPGVIPAFVLHIDRWGRRLHERIEFAPGIAGEALTLVARHNDRSVVFFREPFTHRYWLRVFASDGTPLSEPLLSFETITISNNRVHLSVGEDRIVVNAIGVAAEDGGIGRVYARPFDLDGQPLHELIGVATPTSGAFIGSRVDVQSDGSALITYSSSTNPNIYRSFAQRMSADFQFDQPVIREGLTTALPSDIDTGGYMLNEYRYASGENNWSLQVVEVDASGAPVSPPMQLDSDAMVAKALRSGRFCELSYPWPNPPRVRLFDVDWTALGPSQEFVTPTWAAEATFEFVRVPMTYDESGTFWVVWFTRESSQYGDHFVTALTPFLPGDMNQDSRVNNFDIDPFVLALTNLSAFEAQYGIPQDAAVIIGDINEDGALNNFDIDPFVMLLAGE